MYRDSGLVDFTADLACRLLMKLDEALTVIGAYGRYQLFVFAVIAVFDNFPSIMHMSIMTFIGFEPTHRCKVHSCRFSFFFVR